MYSRDKSKRNSKEQEFEKLRKLQRDKEMNQCTFAPYVNKDKNLLKSKSCVILTIKKPRKLDLHSPKSINTKKDNRLLSSFRDSDITNGHIQTKNPGGSDILSSNQSPKMSNYRDIKEQYEAFPLRDYSKISINKRLVELKAIHSRRFENNKEAYIKKKIQKDHIKRPLSKTILYSDTVFNKNISIHNDYLNTKFVNRIRTARKQEKQSLNKSCEMPELSNSFAQNKMNNSIKAISNHNKTRNLSMRQMISKLHEELHSIRLNN